MLGTQGARLVVTFGAADHTIPAKDIVRASVSIETGQSQSAYITVGNENGQHNTNISFLAPATLYATDDGGVERIVFVGYVANYGASRGENGDERINITLRDDAYLNLVDTYPTTGKTYTGTDVGEILYSLVDTYTTIDPSGIDSLTGTDTDYIVRTETSLWDHIGRIGKLAPGHHWWLDPATSGGKIYYQEDGHRVLTNPTENNTLRPPEKTYGGVRLINSVRVEGSTEELELYDSGVPGTSAYYEDAIRTVLVSAMVSPPITISDITITGSKVGTPTSGWTVGAACFDDDDYFLGNRTVFLEPDLIITGTNTITLDYTIPEDTTKISFGVWSFDDPGELRVVGDSDDSDYLVLAVNGRRDTTATATDAASIAAYGTRHKNIKDKSISTKTQAQSLADSIVADYKDPNITLQLRPADETLAASAIDMRGSCTPNIPCIGLTSTEMYLDAKTDHWERQRHRQEYVYRTRRTGKEDRPAGRIREHEERLTVVEENMTDITGTGGGGGGASTIHRDNLTHSPGMIEWGASLTNVVVARFSPPTGQRLRVVGLGILTNSGAAEANLSIQAYNLTTTTSIATSTGGTTITWPDSLQATNDVIQIRITNTAGVIVAQPFALIRVEA